MKRLHRAVVSALAPCLVAGLLYAGVFAKPRATGSPVKPPAIEHRDRFYGLATVEDRAVWAVGASGKIVHASDIRSGEIWKIQNSGVETNLQAIDAWDPRRAVAVGNDGVVVVTGDGGASWTSAAAPKSAVANKLVRVRTQPEGLAYAVGEYNAVLRSQDFGETWERLTPERDIAWYGLDLIGKKLLVVGEFGRALLSLDKGKTWRPIQTPAKAHLTGVAFKDNLEALAVGLNGTLLHTEDGGETWRVASTGIEEHIYDVIWDGSRYIATGERGLVMASAQGVEWSSLATGLAHERTRLWFTQIRKFQSAYLVSGAGLGLIDNGRYHDLAKPETGRRSNGPATL